MLRTLGYLSRGSVVAALIFTGYILGRFADDPMPVYYVLRPLAVAGVLALLVGLAGALLFGPGAPVAAVAGSFAVAYWRAFEPLGLQLLLMVAVLLLAAVVRKIQTRTGAVIPSRLVTPAIVFACVFFVVGVIRAATTVTFGSGDRTQTLATGSPGPNMYLLLLDGYPRGDTLIQELKIDIGPFARGLTNRGFDIYTDARSERIWTELTMLSLLEGTTDGVPAESVDADDRRAIRERLGTAELPRTAQQAGYEWVVIDSPIGHVTFDGGTHIQHGALNNFEERLIVETLAGPVVETWFRDFPMESLRRHLAASLGSLVTLADSDQPTLALAHLLAPHPPFLWTPGGTAAGTPEYWPRVQLFESVSDITGLSAEDYAAGMRAALEVLNVQLLDTVDAIAARDPNAIIVLFSDHGSRRNFADTRSEWPRTFLAARTPGYPDLLEDASSPTDILRRLLETYLTP